MARQLSFDLSPAPATGPGLQAEDFFVTPATAAAHATVMGDIPWPAGKLVLTGPEGAGKSHLARLWAARHDAMVITATALRHEPPPRGPAIVVEDIDTLFPDAEEPLFHLHNRLAATGGLLLMTSRLPPARIDLALPDLASRLQAAAIAQIGDPDDHLLALLLAKRFADRHILPAAGVIPYLVTRTERSHLAAARIVAALDRAALAQGRGVTVGLARSVLDNPPDPAR
jgi:chromosomal replication initiation ATPase DnaA